MAASVGIPDLQAFNKACRRELGASPRALRGAPQAGTDQPALTALSTTNLGSLATTSPLPKIRRNVT